MKLTILTPIYNRSQYLDRLYESLEKQTSHEFCWIVIDDGSEKKSDGYFAEKQKLSDFKIDYYYKQNGGKHTALNYAHEFIETKYVLILDSDDMLTPDAVETVNKYIEKYDENEEIGIISFQRGTDEDHPFADFEEDETISDCITYRINKKIKGDCCEVVRTQVLKEYAFPVYDGEKFLEESHLWIGSADEYKTVYIRKVIYICKYLEGGLTLSGRRMRAHCPLGGIHSQIVGLNKRCCLSFRIKRAMLLIYYGKIAGYKLHEIYAVSGCPAFMRLMTLPGIILWLKWKNLK